MGKGTACAAGPPACVLGAAEAQLAQMPGTSKINCEVTHSTAL